MHREIDIPGLGTLWVSGPGDEARAIPADGCADIILRDDELLIAGPSTRWILARGSADGPTVGLRFLPGLAGAALGIDPASVQDLGLPASDALHRPFAQRAAAALRAVAVEPLAPLASAAHALPARLELELDHRELRWTLAARGAASAATSTGALAERLDCSERQLQRRMRQSFGYGYAALRSTLRAERARAQIRSGASLAEAAHRAGYADQPHMTREFARVVGLTPARFASAGMPAGGSAAQSSGA